MSYKFRKRKETLRGATIRSLSVYGITPTEEEINIILENKDVIRHRKLLTYPNLYPVGTSDPTGDILKAYKQGQGR